MIPAERTEAVEARHAVSKTRSLFDRVQAYREEHAKAEIALFFGLGFAFDLVTLDRIDNTFNLIQQGAYLFALGAMMLLEQRATLGLFRPTGFWGKAWRFQEDLSHFLFGSLLSSYALFYFKSASGFSAVAFMAVLGFLLLANELPRFRSLGPLVRLSLFSLCVTTYFAYLLPVLIGRVRGWIFALAVAFSVGVSLAMYRKVRQWAQPVPQLGDLEETEEESRAKKQGAVRLLASAFVVQLALCGLYVAGAIPPVPLSVSFIGIYHQVDRAPGGGYLLSHLRPAWRVWEQGDQHFAARPGDRVYVFARIFAPRGFKDRIYVRWAKKDEKRGWHSMDAIPLNISGGRDDGFRGFAYKANYEPGEWRVEIESEDGRDMGLIHFDVEPDASAEPREFLVEKQ